LGAGTKHVDERREKRTFESDVLVNVLFQRFVIVINLTLVFDKVAVLRVIGWVDGDYASSVAGVLDLLRDEVKTRSQAAGKTGNMCRYSN
jgi:hypothetical protein